MSFHVLAVSDNSLKEKLICLVCFVFVLIVVFQAILNRFRVTRNMCGLIFAIFQARFPKIISRKLGTHTVALFENMYFYCTYLT